MRALIILLTLGLAGLAVADPCRVQLKSGYTPSHTAKIANYVVPYTAQDRASAHAGGHAHAHKEILIAEAVFVPVNVQAFDLFVFYGAPLVSTQPTLGVDPQGRELKVLPTAQPQPQTQLQPAPQTQQGPPALSGYEDAPLQPQVQPARQAGPPASLRASCASCHSRQGKLRGGFSLFDAAGNFEAAVNWRAVLEEIQSGRMPPTGSGQPAVPQADIEAIRALVK